MSPEDSNSLNMWEHLSTIGGVLVVSGCVLEGLKYLAHFFKKEFKNAEKVEKIGWGILVFGLTVEIFSGHSIKEIEARDRARLTAEASKALERAAKVNLEIDLLRATNTTLFSNVVEMDAKIKPRSVTPGQRTSILSTLLKAEPKGLVAVRGDWNDPEANKFAHEILSVLVDAGFKQAEEWAEPLTSAKAGLAIIVLNGTNPPPHSVQIMKSFQQAGYRIDPFKVGEDTSLRPHFSGSNSNLVLIWVGTKL